MSGDGHHNQAKSAVIIGRLLGTEGYSSFVHNQVTRYWRRKVMHKQAEKKLSRLEDDFSSIMAEMTEADRLVIGKFISLRSQMSFDTGLRLGLTAFAFERDRIILDGSSGDQEKP